MKFIKIRIHVIQSTKNYLVICYYMLCKFNTSKLLIKVSFINLLIYEIIIK